MPPLDPDTGFLPPGVHDATLAEIAAAFGDNYSRRKLLASLVQTVNELRQHGIADIWLCGSFASTKHRPRDVDLVYDPAGVDVQQLGLLSLGRRHDLKKQRGIDLWPMPSPQPDRKRPGKAFTILEFFSTTRDGDPRGIVRVVADNFTGEADDQEPEPVDDGEEEA